MTLNGSVLPAITTNITINGGNSITLSGNNASRVFYVNAGGTLTLNNLTVTKGYADGDGGAVYSLGTLNINNSRFLDNQTTLNGNGGALIAFGALNVSNSEFAHNKAANGGALYPTGATAAATIAGSHFHDNETKSTTYGWGGAIYMSAGAAVTTTTSTVISNTARFGGAVYVYQPSSLTKLTVNNSTLSGNYGTDTGGSIYNAAGTALLSNITVSGNSATFGGGGIYNSMGGTLTITNVTLSGNQITNLSSGGSNGGGIFNDGTARLTNVTLSGNSALNGSGIANYGTATLKNTLIAKGVSGPNCSSALGGSFNLSDDGSCAFGAGRDHVTLSLGPLANNGGPTLTHMPQPPSPAIDGGTGAGCPATDQRGASRLGVGTACDVGAVEYGAMLPWLYLPLIRR